MPQKIIRTGNSAAVTIPAAFMKDLGIRIGDQVQLMMERDKGRVILHFSGVKQLPLAEDIFRKKRKTS